MSRQTLGDCCTVRMHQKCAWCAGMVSGTLPFMTLRLAPHPSITIHHIPHHHPSLSPISILSSISICPVFSAHATPSTLEALAPNSCSADRACPRRNFAGIIEAKRARGCGALCGHRTGIAGGNLNRACPRHNFSEIMTAKRARGCGAVHGHVLTAQSLVFSLTGRAGAWRMQATIRRHRCSGLQHAASTIRCHRRNIMHQHSWPGKGVSIGSRVSRTPQNRPCTQTPVGDGYRTMANQLGPKWLEGSAGYACPSPSTPSSPATSSSSIIIIISSNI